MPGKLKDIPINEIMQDWRVQQQAKKQAREWAKINIAKYRNNQSQVLSCHSWLLCLHYEAITRLQVKYSISKPEFMVLMGSYLLKRTKNNGFTTRKLSSTLLSWQYNRVYRHLRKLFEKGYIRMEKNPYTGLQRYYLTFDGQRVIEAFNQHYRQVFDDVWGELGDLPNSFSGLLL